MNYGFIKNIFEKNKTLLALIVILFVTIIPRVQTYFLPLATKLAINTVYKDIANESKDYVKEIYGGNISSLAQDKYIDEEYKKRIKDKDELKKLFQEKIKEKKSFWQNEEGQTYLLEFDPYYMYRYTRNLVERGTISDDIIDGKLHDRYSLAPEGKFIRPSLIMYTGYVFHKIGRLFNPDLALVNTLFLVPLFLSIIVSLAIFFFVKRFFGIFVAFVSTFLITLTPMFLTRSACGWFDTDCFNILFPFLAVFLFYSAIKAVSFKKSLGVMALASLSIGLYSLAWHGWWHIFYVILAGTFLYALNTLEAYIKYKDKIALVEVKRIVVLSGIFIAASFLFVVIITYPDRLFQLVQSPLRVISSIYAKKSFVVSLWPNTFLTVAEVKSTDLRHIIYFAGDPLIFFLGMAGLFLLIKPRAKDDQSIQHIGFVFVIWAVGMVFASLRAVRFAFLLAVPQAICCAVTVKFILDLFYEKLELVSRKKRLIFKAAAIFLLLFFGSSIFLTRFYRARDMTPAMNDDYAKVLKRIKDESHPDTLINSWWDYGSWYAAVGRRRVIFDGATQNTPVAFWMARMLLTNDEAEAIGILRMLNNGYKGPLEELETAGLKDIDVIQLLKKIIILDRKDAEILLKEKLSQDVTSKILDYTYKPQPPAYFIVDDHMIDIIQALAILGNWSSEKAFLWQIAHTENNSLRALDIIQKKLGYTKEETVKLYNEALPLTNKILRKWASEIVLFHSSISKGIKEGKTLLFDNNVAVDLDKFNARIKTRGENSWKRPHSLIYPEGDGFKEIIYEDADVPLTVLLVPDGDSYKSIILDYDLAKSMLVRLFFLKGHGLKHFRFLYSEKEEGFGNINVWEIDWQGKQQNKISLDLK